MPSYTPVIKNGAGGAIFYATMQDANNPGSFKIAPTLAAGDFKISIDGGTFANLTTLPTVTPVGDAQIKFILSQAETDGDNLTIKCVDQTAPKEWVDAAIHIQTAAGSFDTIKADTTAIRAKTDANLDATVSSRLAPTTAGRTLDVSVGGEAGIDWGNIGNPGATVDLANTSIYWVTYASVTFVTYGISDGGITAATLSASATAEIADAVWEELLTDHISVPDSAGWVVNENIRANVEGITYTTAAINDDTDNIQNRLPVALIGGRMDSSVGAVAVTTNLGYSVPAIGRGMVDAGATATDLPTAEFAPGGGSVDQFVGRVVLFDADTVTVGLRGCARPISASTLASLPTLTVDTLPTLPAAGDTFSVV